MDDFFVLRPKIIINFFHLWKFDCLVPKITHRKFPNELNLSVYFNNLHNFFLLYKTLTGILIECFNLTNTIGGVVCIGIMSNESTVRT